MSDLNENKNNETESKKPTSPKSPKSPATPKVPTTLQSPVSQAVQSDLQAPQDLQVSKPIENLGAPASQKIKAEDLELLKTPLETKPDDLQILDTKPGNITGLNEEEKNLLDDSFVKKEHVKSDLKNIPVDSLGNLKEEKVKTNSEGIATEVIEELVFSKALDPNERKHFQLIIKSNKEATASLRKQVQALVAYIGTLPETEDSKALLKSLSTL